MELTNCRQLSNEDVREFANRIEQILARLNDACVDKVGRDSADSIIQINSGIALSAFQNGLLKNYKIVVKACSFKTLKEAVEKAIEEDCQLNNYNASQTTSKVRCQLCNKVGHAAQSCYSLKNNVKNSQPNQNSSSSQNPSNSKNNENKSSTFHNKSTNNSSVVCAYCKKSGHHLRECRKLMYNNSKREAEAKIMENTEKSFSEQSTSQSNAENSHTPDTNSSTSCRVKDL